MKISQYILCLESVMKDRGDLEVFRKTHYREWTVYHRMAPSDVEGAVSPVEEAVGPNGGVAFGPASGGETFEALVL